MADPGPGDTSHTDAYSVTLSAAARQASAGMADALENYRLPDWLPALMPTEAIDGDALNAEMHAYWSRVGELGRDGELSAADRVQARSLLESLPVRQAMMANDAYRERYRDEIQEYNGIFQSLYAQAKTEQGITTREDYVEKVLGAPGDNTQLRDSLVRKLLDNPRALELMDRLGMERPILA